MKRSMILKQREDLMIYHLDLIKNHRIQIKHQHSLIHQIQCQPMVFIIILTEAIIIQIQIKCIRLHHHHNLIHHHHRHQIHLHRPQHPAIYQLTVIRSIIIQARIDIGPDSRTQLTKGETFLFISFSFHKFTPRTFFWTGISFFFFVCLFVCFLIFVVSFFVFFFLQICFICRWNLCTSRVHSNRLHVAPS